MQRGERHHPTLEVHDLSSHFRSEFGILRPMIRTFCALLCFLIPLPAFSHGGFPATYGIQQDEAGTLNIFTTFGILTKTDSESYRLICEEAYGGEPIVPILKTTSGAYLIGHFKGLYRIDETGCNREEILLDVKIY